MRDFSFVRLAGTETTGAAASFQRFALAVTSSLDVVPQEIVDIDCCSADGRLLVEAGVRSMPVVLMVEG